MGQNERIWRLDSGIWTEIDFWDERYDDWDAQRRKMGFQPVFEIDENQNANFNVSLYERAEPDPRYLIELWDCARGLTLAAGTLPDALDLLARYAPIATAMNIAGTITQIQNHSEYSLLTDIMVSLQANAGDISRAVSQENHNRAEAHRRWVERRREAKEREERDQADGAP